MPSETLFSYCPALTSSNSSSKNIRYLHSSMNKQLTISRCSLKKLTLKAHFISSLIFDTTWQSRYPVPGSSYQQRNPLSHDRNEILMAHRAWVELFATLIYGRLGHGSSATTSQTKQLAYLRQKFTITGKAEGIGSEFVHGGPGCTVMWFDAPTAEVLAMQVRRCGIR
jgi:hypothetical protein